MSWERDTIQRHLIQLCIGSMVSCMHHSVEHVRWCCSLGVGDAASAPQLASHAWFKTHSSSPAPWKQSWRSTQTQPTPSQLKSKQLSKAPRHYEQHACPWHCNRYAASQPPQIFCSSACSRDKEREATSEPAAGRCVIGVSRPSTAGSPASAERHDHFPARELGGSSRRGCSHGRR